MTQAEFATDPASASSGPFPSLWLEQARTRASHEGRKLIEVLDERTNLPPAQFMARLGQTLNYPVFDMEALYRLQPAFDLLPFTDAMQKNCVLVRDDNALLCVLADPFDLALQAWIETRCNVLLAWGITHSNNLSAFFAMQEETLRA
ncbi:MAG: hypothetical protein RL748_444, partial [Pseudomonadota bacterium]